MRPYSYGGVADEAQFVRIVRAAFAHRRKTLSNSLRDEGLSPDRVALTLTQAGIEPGRRAETLTLEEFTSLANAWTRWAEPAGDR
jgi:16S rRNA (adenine1518-N6/adenine1519-N6)-dimethyltransferase